MKKYKLYYEKKKSTNMHLKLIFRNHIFISCKGLKKIAFAENAYVCKIVNSVINEFRKKK